MKRKTIKISERELKEMVLKSVKRIISEGTFKTYPRDEKKSQMCRDWDEYTDISYPENRMKRGEMYWPDENMNVRTDVKPGHFAMKALEGDKRAKQIRPTVRQQREAGMNVGPAYDYVMDKSVRESKINKIIKNSVKKALMESISNYDAYVLVDEASEEILGNYGPDEVEMAIQDAKEMQRKADPYGRYLVVGCVGNQYDLDDIESIVYDSNENKSYKI